MTEYVHVGPHADVLASGRPVGPGERLTHTDLDLTQDDHRGEDQHLVDEGRLVDVRDFGGPSNTVLAGDDLQARARELEIEGRSKMSAEELRAAIVTAESGQEEDHAA